MKALIVADDEFAAKRTPDCFADVLISLGKMPDSVILEVAATGFWPGRAIMSRRPCLENRFKTQDLHLDTIEIEGVTFSGFGGAWKYKHKVIFVTKPVRI